MSTLAEESKQLPICHSKSSKALFFYRLLSNTSRTISKSLQTNFNPYKKLQLTSSSSGFSSIELTLLEKIKSGSCEGTKKEKERSMRENGNWGEIGRGGGMSVSVCFLLAKRRDKRVGAVTCPRLYLYVNSLLYPCVVWTCTMSRLTSLIKITKIPLCAVIERCHACIHVLHRLTESNRHWILHLVWTLVTPSRNEKLWDWSRTHLNVLLKWLEIVFCENIFRTNSY